MIAMMRRLTALLFAVALVIIGGVSASSLGQAEPAATADRGTELAVASLAYTYDPVPQLSKHAQPPTPVASTSQGALGREPTSALSRSDPTAATGFAAEGAAVKAAAFQGKGAYAGVDAWENVTLRAGTVVHAGEPGVTGFATSDAVASAIGHDAVALNQGLQVASRAGTYRPGFTAFRLTWDVQVARSVGPCQPSVRGGRLRAVLHPRIRGRHRTARHSLDVRRRPVIRLSASSADPERPYANLLPIVDALVARGNQLVDHGFDLNPDGWRCRFSAPLELDTVAELFELPDNIQMSDDHDSILDRLTWCSIEGPGANS